jgi:hypothetical protein
MVQHVFPSDLSAEYETNRCGHLPTLRTMEREIEKVSNKSYGSNNP